MKILFMTQHFLPFLGGVEMHIYELSKRLVRDGVDIEVICQKETGTSGEEVIDGIRVHRLPSFRYWGYDFTRFTPGMLLSSICNDADVLHLHAYGYFPTYASIFSRKPTLITTHSVPNARIYPFWDLSRVIPLKASDYIVATTELEKRHLMTKGLDANKVVVIPNGVNLTEIKDVLLDHSSSKAILCLARLVRDKGQDTLIKAMVKVVSKLPEIKLWVVGSGDDLDRLKELTSKLGINGSVEFKGAAYGDVKLTLLKSSRLLCVAPRKESFGIVFLEAMAYGLPIVTTKVGGIPEVVGDSALLVPPDNPSALADALIKVLTDRQLAARLGEVGFTRVQKFDWEPIVKRYEKLYEKMVSGT